MTSAGQPAKLGFAQGSGGTAPVLARAGDRRRQPESGA